MHLGSTIVAIVFGPGLSIAHRGTITVNRGCTVGANAVGTRSFGADAVLVGIPAVNPTADERTAADAPDR